MEFEIIDDKEKVDELFEEEEFEEAEKRGRRKAWDYDLLITDIVQMKPDKVYKTSINKFVNRYYTLDDEPDIKAIKRFLRRAAKEVDFEYSIEGKVIYIRRK